MSGHEPLCEWDAAYLLGALNAADARRFEEHLAGCVRCQESLEQLGTVPPLLARLTEHDQEMAPWQEPAGWAQAPDATNVTPLRARGRRRRPLLLAAAAVALLAAGVLGGAWWGLHAGTPAPVVERVALQPVTVQNMKVQVGLEAKKWGTALTVDCDYPPAGEYPSGFPDSYELVLLDREGDELTTASWKAVAGKQITVQAATALAVGDIAAISVRQPDGTTVLSAPLKAVAKP